MEILIISGKSASGKDTFANIMREKMENVGCKCLTIHFADLVKYYLKQYYNWDGIKDEHGRTMLQHLGTDQVRASFPDYWSETVAKFLASISDDFDCAFIPDARFENEIEIVKKYNPQAISIRIERYNDDHTPYLNPTLTEEQHKHPSETSLDDYKDFDFFVHNIGDIENLNFAADIVLSHTNLLR